MIEMAGCAIRDKTASMSLPMKRNGADGDKHGGSESIVITPCCQMIAGTSVSSSRSFDYNHCRIQSTTLFMLPR